MTANALVFEVKPIQAHIVLVKKVCRLFVLFKLMEIRLLLIVYVFNLHLML